MRHLPICDSLFSHDPGKINSVERSEHFSWKRTLDILDKFVILTDLDFHRVDYLRQHKLKVYAYLVEPYAVHPHAYDYIKANFLKFDRVFTHDVEVLAVCTNSVFLPFGGCWIEPGERAVYEKTKRVSIIASGKKSLPGHQLRHEAIAALQKIGAPLDVFGRDVRPIANKIVGLKDYQFQIVIENSRKSHYFSEKLIDCFQTGTVPIYWGCPSVEQYFDLEGIINFESIEDLVRIVTSLSDECYIKRAESVRRNFEVSRRFLVIEDNFLHHESVLWP